ncbi:hypothetical protein EV579_3279 [Bacillus sp. BK450]|nr:hypothetical protein EV579_3279 [Bacillus sp. BK450]
MLLRKKKRDSFVSLKKHCITTVLMKYIYLLLPFPIHAIQRYNAQQSVHQTNPLI